MAPVQAPGEEVHGAADLEALAPEAVVATRVRAREAAVGVVAQDAPINTEGDKR